MFYDSFYKINCDKKKKIKKLILYLKPEMR